MAQDKKEKKVHPNIKARALPCNREAEQAVLGSAMIDTYAAVHIMGELGSEDFYVNAHKDIFSAMQSLYLKNVPIDIVTLVQELEAMGAMTGAGGITYLTSLSNIVPSSANHRHYTEIVKKNSLLRRLIHSGQKILDMAYTGDIENDALSYAENEIFSISQQQDKSYLKSIQEPLTGAIKHMEELSRDPKAFRGVPTGFTRLNAVLNGFQSGDLIVIGARPSQGKTSIGMNFVQYAALNNERKTESGQPHPYSCAVFSLEMPEKAIAKRLLCSVAKVSMSKASSGNLSKEEWQRIMEAKARLSASKIFVDDSSLNTPMDILSKCRRLKREKGLDLVMIDYLGLMKSGSRQENKQQEISEITRLLKIAAKELNVPIILLSQLSREVEKRQVKLPQMSDLRESGAIEQDADVIIFIYREFDPNDMSIDEYKRNKVELIISKHRNGETGRVEVRWRPEYVCFEDLPNSIQSLAENTPDRDNGRFIGEGNFFAENTAEHIISGDDDDDIFA